MKQIFALATAFFAATSLNAAVIGTNGSLSSDGVAASIIAAPPDANDDAAFNQAIQAFDEAQNVYLGPGGVNTDQGIVGINTLVDSHMIFLNSGPGNSSRLIEHGAGGNQNAASFTFDGLILGVMSNSNGSLEVASTSFLGAPGTAYPGAPFGARGMEGNPFDNTNDDWYAFSGNTIRLGMRVTEPGDWIRVVTAAPAIPVPASLPLLLAGLGGLGYIHRRKKKPA